VTTGIFDTAVRVRNSRG